MTWAELARTAAYLHERLVGARVQKVRQPGDDTIVLDCRAPGQTYWLWFSAHARFFRAVVFEQNPGVSSDAGAFCGLLRKHLTGGRIEEVALESHDRVLTVNIAKPDEQGTVAVWTLVAELFGPKSNLLLLDSAGVVRGALLDKRLATRGLAIGEPYVATQPGAPPKGDDRDVPVEEMATAFAEAEAEFEWDGVRQRLVSSVTREAKKSRKFRAKLQQEIESLPDPDRTRQGAELLISQLDKAHKGQTAVELPSWEDPAQTVRVELNPALSPRANAERLFKTARRSQRKQEHLGKQTEQIELRLLQLDDLAARLGALAEGGDLDAFADDFHELGVKLEKPRQAPPRRREQTPAGPQPFFAADGARIYVGRSAAENDYITFQIARGNDYWLHVEGAAGSHVVVRLPRGDELTSETLLDAASLAVLHSSIKNSGAGSVLYTRRKRVHKPKHGKPGLVHAGEVKSIHVRLDDARLRRLYETRSPQS